jgi:hypothetical protein
MSGMSRRDLLRASAGAAAVAVPMSVLASHTVGASSAQQVVAAAGGADVSAGAVNATEGVAGGGFDLAGPVMFSIRDAASGEVSILHGTAEVIVRDRQLVDRIVHAARRAV